jgi:oligoendopeptidase F
MTFTQTKWSLADLYPGFNTPELESAFDVIEEQVTSFEGLRANLTPDIPADRFLDVVRASEEMTRVAIKLDAFSGLAFAADTQDQTALSLQSRVQQFIADMENRVLFFDLWWKDLDDENAQRLMETSGDYQYYLEKITGRAGHQPEERDRLQRAHHAV